MLDCFKCKVFVLNGLPLVAQFSVGKAEPDVGIMHNYIDDLNLVDRNGRWAEWAEKKLTEDDWDSIKCQCWESLKYR